MAKVEDHGHQASVHRPEGEVLSLLPVGLLQTVASVKHGYWYSRSDEFLGQGLMQTLRWLRMPGDTLFAIGAIAFVVFIFGLGLG
jgi:nitric oxide reductase subunit B